MPKELKADDRMELINWLKCHNIVINNRTRRELSDVSPIALIIKKFNHKLVDMNNYPSRNSFALKLANWETFNYKVLTKMGLHQSKTALHNLAQGLCGAVENLLYELMMWSRFQLAKRNTRGSGSVTTELSTRSDGGLVSGGGCFYDKDIVKFDIERLNEGQIVKVTQKMIDYDLYEHMLRECKEKDKYINAIQQKATYLENIVKLKEERINELVDQLTRLAVSILSKMHNLESNNLSCKGDVMYDNTSDAIAIDDGP